MLPPGVSLHPLPRVGDADFYFLTDERGRSLKFMVSNAQRAFAGDEAALNGAVYRALVKLLQQPPVA